MVCCDLLHFRAFVGPCTNGVFIAYAHVRTEPQCDIAILEERRQNKPRQVAKINHEQVQAANRRNGAKRESTGRLPQETNHEAGISTKAEILEEQLFFLWFGRSRSKARSFMRIRKKTTTRTQVVVCELANHKPRHKTYQQKGKTQILRPDLRLTFPRTAKQAAKGQEPNRNNHKKIAKAGDGYDSISCL